MPTWTSEDYRQWQIRQQYKAGAERVRPAQPQHDQGQALVSPAPREDQSRERFEVVFIVYAVRPQDWDNPHTKCLQDLLVETGLLPSDDWQTLQGKVITRQAESKAHERTEVEISRVRQ